MLECTAADNTDEYITANHVHNNAIGLQPTFSDLSFQMTPPMNLQIMQNGSDHYFYFPGTAKYVF